jgi:CheY-like chemotaxis protein
MSANGYLISDDLLFISRIVGTARDLGLRIVVVRTTADLFERTQQDTPACVIVDLSNPGLKIGAVVTKLKGAEGSTPRVVAYGSHVDVNALRGAREAGCDVVLPRSRFTEDLAARLPEWFGQSA